jgi:hypothetical protein
VAERTQLQPLPLEILVPHRGHGLRMLKQQVERPAQERTRAPVELPAGSQNQLREVVLSRAVLGFELRASVLLDRCSTT